LLSVNNYDSPNDNCCFTKCHLRPDVCDPGSYREQTKKELGLVLMMNSEKKEKRPKITGL